MLFIFFAGGVVDVLFVCGGDWISLLAAECGCCLSGLRWELQMELQKSHSTITARWNNNQDQYVNRKHVHRHTERFLIPRHSTEAAAHS